MHIDRPQLPASLTPFTRNYVQQQTTVATLAERARCEAVIRGHLYALVRKGNWPPVAFGSLARCMADVHAGTIATPLPESEARQMREAYREALAKETAE